MTHKGGAGNIFLVNAFPVGHSGEQDMLTAHWLLDITSSILHFEQQSFSTVGQDLEAQTIAAVDAVMVDLPKNQGVFGQQLTARV